MCSVCSFCATEWCISLRDIQFSRQPSKGQCTHYLLKRRIRKQENGGFMIRIALQFLIIVFIEQWLNENSNCCVFISWKTGALSSLFSSKYTLFFFLWSNSDLVVFLISWLYGATLCLELILFLLLHILHTVKKIWSECRYFHRP